MSTSAEGIGVRWCRDVSNPELSTDLFVTDAQAKRS
jgi:hypothetical protein